MIDSGINNGRRYRARARVCVNRSSAASIRPFPVAGNGIHSFHHYDETFKHQMPINDDGDDPTSMIARTDLGGRVGIIPREKNPAATSTNANHHLPPE